MAGAAPTLLLLTAFCGAAVACSGGPPPTPPEAPPQQVDISPSDRLGPYLAATVTGRAGSHRFLFAPSAACRSVLSSGTRVSYLPEGRFGTLRGPAGPATCEPVGVNGLAAWRDQLPQRRSQYLQPREQARLRPAGRGPGVLLARGSLPLALELRFPSPEDIVAVLPDSLGCRALLSSGSGMLEYRARGPEVLVFPDEGCPVLGLARPLALD